MKPKALLIMPRFMSYDSLIEKELSKQFEVSFLTPYLYRDETLAEWNKACPRLINSALFFAKPIRWKLRDPFCNLFTSDLLNEIDSAHNKFDLVVCINGDFLSKDFFLNLRKANPNATFVYYAWDDLSSLFSRCPLEVFDRIYSYSLEDCRRIDAQYLPMFTEGKNRSSSIVAWEDRRYDIAFIASAHTDRRKIAEQLEQRFSSKLKLFIYLVDSNHEPLSQDDYFDIVSQSKCILEAPLPLQKGPTTRPFDAAALKTKVVTTNPRIRRYPIYSDNILIVKRNDISIPRDFLDTEFKELETPLLSLEQWTKIIVEGIDLSEIND